MSTEDSDESRTPIDEPREVSGAALSPLWMVTREPALHDLVEYLDLQRRRILQNPAASHRLRFSKSAIDQARLAFSRMIRGGEEHLHRLCELLGRSLYEDGQYRLRSVVVAQSPGASERFTLMQPLTHTDLYAQTDLDLGNRLLERFRLLDGPSWERALLVANFVEYEPLAPNGFGIHKVISRIKAEEEIWNKVVDEIFHLDRVVKRDKQLRHFSPYVKDIFGVKIVVGSSEEARRLQVALESHAWTAASLGALEVQDSNKARELSFLEVKDYLSDQGKKASGWRAIKSVVRWNDHLFEIQLQPLLNYHNELERFTVESHEEFKAQRESIRNEVATQIPLFGFYRDLLRWLFQQPNTEPPQFGRVEIMLTD